MKIKEIESQRIKISKNSITAVDPAGKTKGIVRNVTNFYELRMNIQCNYSGILRRSGVDPHCVYYTDNQIYYIYDTRKDETFQRYYSNEPDTAREKISYMQYAAAAGKVAKIMPVLHCYIVQ